MNVTRISDWYVRRFRQRPFRGAAKMAGLPVGQLLNTDDALRYENARMVRTAVAYAAGELIDGDYMEFGVFQGRTFVEAWYALQYHGLDEVRLWAFDSFEGLPESDGNFREGQFRSSRSTFEKNLRLNGVQRATVVQGFYDQTLAGFSGGEPRCAVAFIDCDLYSSTVPVLKYLTDRLSNGAVVIFDDWFCYRGSPDEGEQRACSEWLTANPQFSLSQYRDFGWAGRAFLFHRRDEATFPASSK